MLVVCGGETKLMLINHICCVHNVLELYWPREMIVWIQGSKQDIRSQCVYFAIRTMVLFKVLFEVLLRKNHFFIKRNFQMKYCNLLFIVFIVALVCHIFF